jgi:hypothetical protein
MGKKMVLIGCGTLLVLGVLLAGAITAVILASGGEEEIVQQETTSELAVPDYEIAFEENFPLSDANGSIPALTIGVDTTATSERVFRTIAEELKANYPEQDVLEVWPKTQAPSVVPEPGIEGQSRK